MTDRKIDFFTGYIFKSICYCFFIFHYIFALIWNRAHQPCPSLALLLTSWRAQSQSWPQRTWAAQTRPGENSWLKVMSSMKARVVTSSPMMVRALIIDIPNNFLSISLPSKTWCKFDNDFFLSKSHQEPQGKHPQPQNRPWAETHLRHDGGTHGQSTPWQRRSPIRGYFLCVNECALCVLVCSVSGEWWYLNVSQGWLAEPCQEMVCMEILRRDHW